MPVDNQWDKEVDVLVLGGGAGGLAAALVSSIEGLESMVVEKTDMLGGTASTSAGSIWIPGNKQSRDAGHKDDTKDAEKYMRLLAGRDESNPIRDAYLATGPQMLDYLRERSDVRFVPCGKHPDYRDLPGAAVCGRALVPEMFDGRLLGKDFEKVRPPIPEFLVLGGMMVGKADLPPLIGRFQSFKSFVYSGQLVSRYLLDRLRFSRGTRLVMGNALVARLFYSLRKRNVPVLLNSHVSQLVKDGNVVLGAVVQTGKASQRIRARRGVVIATGGFGHSRALRDEFMPTNAADYSLAGPGNTGDGIELARRSGAAVDVKEHGRGGFWTPMSVVKRADGTSGLFPHLLLDRAKPGLIAVNERAERFVNEGCSYHDFVEAMLSDKGPAQGTPAHLLCEASFVAKYGLGVIYPGTQDLKPFERSGYIQMANTISELAAKLHMNPSALSKTVDRFNAFAEQGSDVDFGKGNTELNRFNGDPEVKPNPCLAAIKKGPFVALAVWPGDIATSAGLRTNGDAQVLDENGIAISGLYACGNDMASVMLGTYPGPGTTLGPALTFAYRAAMHAAGKSDLAALTAIKRITNPNIKQPTAG
ncbi:succinate dehydrogenase/fumarate reductase flavoprotein subunit [Paraburkholderia sp. RAU2J]|uniref:FAD-binding protein n=1 Tax=Paraburkholderia sp. RAU2J TaxID=1938810 RepID=UPI000EB4734B|nr:FAD-binding protein [Paraburkholderia sp. RAU2J]RKT20349.1 succinate dehydrogenase/fumarate reductase flavoprotein subunit [Paraburkholderia sp. RAU2J]